MKEIRAELAEAVKKSLEDVSKMLVNEIEQCEESFNNGEEMKCVSCKHFNECNIRGLAKAMVYSSALVAGIIEGGKEKREEAFK